MRRCLRKAGPSRTNSEGKGPGVAMNLCSRRSKDGLKGAGEVGKQVGLGHSLFWTTGKGWGCQGLSGVQAGFSSVNPGLHGQPRLCPFDPGLS